MNPDVTKMVITMNQELSTFYNTIGEHGAELQAGLKKAGEQARTILLFFVRHYPEDFTPSEIHQHVLVASPITSVRRAITDLTDADFLIKTDRKQRGPWGKWEHLWRVRIAKNEAPKQASLWGGIKKAPPKRGR